MVSENYSQLLAVSRYPSKPKFGWLAKICQIEGTTAKVEFHPTDSGFLVDRCNEEIKQKRQDLSAVREESTRQSIEQGIKDMSNMITRIAIKGEMVGFALILLLVQASDEDKLNERVKRVKSIISSNGGSTRVLANYTKEAYQSITPYGLPNQELGDIAFRNMPLSTLVGGFFNAQSGINDGIGFKIGKSESGKPIIINTWKRGNDRTNGNWYVAGVPGVGKSAFVKFLLMLEYALGTRVIILDPEREFVDLAKNMGGKVVGCSGGVGGRVNPLQARKAPRQEDDIEEEDNEEFFKDEGHGVSDLALHFQTHRTFLKLYKKDINELQMAMLEEVLEKTYSRFNIVWDTDVTKIKNKDWPIYSDLYKDLLKAVEENPGDPNYKIIVAQMRSIAIGADSYIWNGHTDIDETSDFVVLDVSGLLDSDDSIIRSQFHNINSWAWHQIASDRSQRIAYATDEGHLTVDPNCPQSMIFAKNLAKRIRKYEGSYIFITHAPSDILDPAVKRYGQAIIDSACYKFIMGMDGKNLKETKELFNLTDAEEAKLLAKQRGQGILFAGAVRIWAHIKISQVFLDLMGKAGGR